MKPWKRDTIVVVFCLIIIIAGIPVLAGPAPPATNTIQQDVGTNFPSVNAYDYFYRGTNLTNFMENVTDWLTNHSAAIIWAQTVEWGLVNGTTGDWFNYTTILGEPVYIGLQMHPTNLTYDSQLVYPCVYDKDATHWQLALYWTNGTQIVDGTPLMVMYHARWDPDLQDPNAPIKPNEDEEPA